MFEINCLLEINNYGKIEENLTDAILDINVSEDYYKLKGLDEKEYPKNAWAIWATQNDCDRKNKAVWVSLCNEGMRIDDWIDGEEKEKVLQYIKQNGIYEKANFEY